MKKTKRFAAAVAAIAMAVSMMTAGSLTAFAESSELTTYSITITSPASDEGVHTYQYAQIFTGTVAADGKITAAQFGSGITAATLFGAVKNLTGIPATLSAESSADDFVAALASVTDEKALASALNKVVTYTDLTSSTKVPAGYYLISDKVNPTASNPAGANTGAQTAFLLKIIKNTDLSEVAKTSAPSADKQVYDNDDGANKGEGEVDNDGWGETADHNVNETFQFRLIATLPNEEGLDKFKTYRLVFNDTLGTGVVFDSIDSVKIGTSVNDGIATELTASQYSTTAAANTTGAWSLTIPDVKLGDASADIKGKVVVVTYNAHLDPSTCAVAGTADDNNPNTLYLQYSNNPNYQGSGEFGSKDEDNNENTSGQTPEDTVFVFTYKIDNVKVDAADNAIRLGGAVFNIKKGDTLLKFTWNADKEAYVYDINGSADVISNDGSDDSGLLGKFNILGLDAGTYTIEEKTAPESYNLNKEKITATITAGHKESAADVPSLTLTQENGDNTVPNTQGAVLPETGGIGTTMFYVGGGALAAAAGVVLIAKKRSKKED